MKRRLLLLGLALAFSAGAFAQISLYNTPKTEREKMAEQQRMEVFRGQDNGGVIPHASANRLEDWADRTDKVYTEPEGMPLSSNPALYKSLKKNKQKDGNLSDLEIETILNQSTWGTLRLLGNGTSEEDGRVMVYAIEHIPSNVVYGMQQYYKGLKFSYFDDTLGLVKTFEFYSNTDTTMSFGVMPFYGTRFFNSDANIEFVIHAHSFDGAQFGQGPISCRDTVYVVNENGEVLGKIGNTQSLYMHRSGTKTRVAAFQSNYASISDTAVIDIYDAKNFLLETRKPQATFKLPNNLTSYTEGTSFDIKNIEGTSFYALFHNQKPFIVSGNSSSEPVIEKNNLYQIDLYNMNTYALEKTISIPLFGQEDNEWSVGSTLYFGDYLLTKHVFNDDDKIEVVYGMSRYEVSCDCNILDFYLVDEDGNIIKEMISDVSGLTKLQTLPGKHDEYMLWCDKGYGIEAIQVYDMETMEAGPRFTANYNGDRISLFYERLTDANGNINYIIALGTADMTETNVYGQLVYYNREGKEVKRVRVDIGFNAQSFEPILNSATLNPYTFISDSKQEYLWFMKEYDAATQTYGGAFAMANEDERLYIWRERDGYPMSGAGILASADGTRISNLYVIFSNQRNESKTVFYKLPFDKVTLQGEGTQEKPYIITNPVELDMVRNYPEAWFELGNDIDMSAFTGVGGKGFTAINDFKGHFDGKNHVIENIRLNGKYVGLFGSVAGATICNLQMRNVTFATLNASTYGCIIGMASGAKVYNCHVATDINMRAETACTLGGLFGSLYGTAHQCSFEGNIVINGTAPREVGGIVGSLSANQKMTDVVSKGAIQCLGKNVGGIVGASQNASLIGNAWSSMNVRGASNAGGIAGNSRGYTYFTHATGKVECDENPNSIAAGLVAQAMKGATMTDKMIKYSFALNDTVVSGGKYARIAAVNSDIDSNYALATMVLGQRDDLKPISASDTSAKKNRMHGESGTMEQFNEAFYKANGWSFGQDSASPWVMSGSMPRLWFEFKVRSVEFPYKEISVRKGDKFTLEPQIIPSDATNKAVRYKSDNVAVATVNAEGVVTANNGGSAIITVTTAEGGYTATCVVNVTVPVETVNLEKEQYVLAVGEVAILHTTVLPENSTNKNVLFRSLNSAVVSCWGNTILGVAVGETKIVAVSEDGEASDTCMVKVSIPVEDIYLNESSITLSKEKPTFQLEATLYPEGAASDLVWSSDNEKVASVKAGLVSGHAKGETIVSVSTPDGSAAAACYVTVTEDINVGVKEETECALNVRFLRPNLFISSSLPINAVSVWNIAGTSVYSTEKSATTSLLIPASGWQQGMYLVQIRFENGLVRVVKVVK